MMSRLRLAIALLFIMAVFALVLHGRGRAQVGTVIPTPSPLPSATPTPRTGTLSRNSYCNCTAPGRPVIWAGNVQATGYFQARQLAVSQCSAYLGSKPVSPLIPTPAVSFGGAPTFAPLAVNACAQCACN
jgi:hypothetical protein